LTRAKLFERAARSGSAHRALCSKVSQQTRLRPLAG